MVGSPSEFKGPDGTDRSDLGVNARDAVQCRGYQPLAFSTRGIIVCDGTHGQLCSINICQTLEISRPLPWVWFKTKAPGQFHFVH